MSNGKNETFIFNGFLDNSFLFKAVRSELGLTQKEIADRLGWTARQVSYVESGKRDLQQQTLLALESLIIKSNKMIDLNKKGIHFKDQKTHYAANTGSLIFDLIGLNKFKSKEFNYQNVIILGNDNYVFKNMYEQSKKLENRNNYNFSFKNIDSSHVNELQKTLNIVVDSVDNNNPVSIFIDDFTLNLNQINDDVSGILSIFKFARRLNMTFIVNLTNKVEINSSLEKLIDEIFTYKIQPIKAEDVAIFCQPLKKLENENIGYLLKDGNEQLKYIIEKGHSYE